MAAAIATQWREASIALFHEGVGIAFEPFSISVDNALSRMIVLVQVLRTLRLSCPQWLIILLIELAGLCYFIGLPAVPPLVLDPFNALSCGRLPLG